ncbi:uncharacterized protein TrAtP1_010308 [Trichoderma atroviride]|uniref:uncharacterized protein n=1 Tax=Hypocrea atroviridis TaxID=63577 RepID=UPI00332477E3|nr:hypothetical protein TrAtP1_010308 [Trichoderma atroviride]
MPSPCQRPPGTWLAWAWPGAELSCALSRLAFASRSSQLASCARGVGGMIAAAAVGIVAAGTAVVANVAALAPEFIKLRPLCPATKVLAIGRCFSFGLLQAPPLR